MTGRVLARDLVGALIELDPPQGRPVFLARPVPLRVWNALFSRGWLAREGDSVWITKLGRQRLARAIATSRRDIGSAHAG